MNPDAVITLVILIPLAAILFAANILLKGEWK